MSKRQQSIKPITEAIIDHAGYKVGDVVYCVIKGKPHRGAISDIHLKEGQEPQFSFMDDASMRYRVSRFADIITQPTQKQVQAVEREIRKNQPES